MTMMSVVGECFYWYRLTRVVPDKFHRAAKRLCVKRLCDCKAHGFNWEDAMDHSRWRKQIEIFDDHDGCEWVNVPSGTSSPGLFQTNSTEP